MLISKEVASQILRTYLLLYQFICPCQSAPSSDCSLQVRWLCAAVLTILAQKVETPPAETATCQRSAATCNFLSAIHVFTALHHSRYGWVYPRHGARRHTGTPGCCRFVQMDTRHCATASATPRIEWLRQSPWRSQHTHHSGHPSPIAGTYGFQAQRKQRQTAWTLQFFYNQFIISATLCKPLTKSVWRNRTGQMLSK